MAEPPATKHAGAVALAKLRWQGTTPRERSDAARHAVTARWARAKAAQAESPAPRAPRPRSAG
jgi:hypothetical protein